MIHHWGACQAPPVGGVDLVSGLRPLGFLVLDALSLIEDDAVKPASWVKQRTLLGKLVVQFWIVLVRTIPLFDMLVVLFPFRSDGSVRCEHDVVPLEVGEGKLFPMHQEDAQPMRSLQLLLDLMLPLLDKGNRANDQVGLWMSEAISFIRICLGEDMYIP